MSMLSPAEKAEEMFVNLCEATMLSKWTNTWTFKYDCESTYEAFSKTIKRHFPKALVARIRPNEGSVLLVHPVTEFTTKNLVPSEYHPEYFLTGRQKTNLLEFVLRESKEDTEDHEPDLLLQLMSSPSQTPLLIQRLQRMCPESLLTELRVGDTCLVGIYMQRKWIKSRCWYVGFSLVKEQSHAST